MQIKITGHQIDVGDALRQHVTDRLEDIIEKYFQQAIEATVVISKEANHIFNADISIHVGKGILLQTHFGTDDPYAAFDQAADRMAKRMRRYKGRLQDHHKKMLEAEAANMSVAYYTLQGGAETEDSDDETQAGQEPAIIAEMAMTIQSMSVSDAVMRMEIADLPALLFRNAGHGEINMVYRRKDGNIGWVDPSIEAAQKKAG